MRTSRCYDTFDEKVVLGNETKQWRYDREQYREFIGPLADSMFDFAHALSKMHLHQAEFALLTAIAVFSGDYLWFLYWLISLRYFRFYRNYQKR